jgi:hypothetical protein
MVMVWIEIYVALRSVETDQGQYYLGFAAQRDHNFQKLASGAG